MTAYLLLRMKRVSQTPVPVVIGACIASAPADSMTTCGDEFYAELFRRDGKDYDDAYKSIINEIKNGGDHYEWLKFFLGDFQIYDFHGVRMHFNSYNIAAENARHNADKEKSKEIKLLKQQLTEATKSLIAIREIAKGQVSG